MTPFVPLNRYIPIHEFTQEANAIRSEPYAFPPYELRQLELPLALEYGKFHQFLMEHVVEYEQDSIAEKCTSYKQYLKTATQLNMARADVRDIQNNLRQQINLLTEQESRIVQAMNENLYGFLCEGGFVLFKRYYTPEKTDILRAAILEQNQNRQDVWQYLMWNPPMIPTPETPGTDSTTTPEPSSKNVTRGTSQSTAPISGTRENPIQLSPTPTPIPPPNTRSRYKAQAPPNTPEHAECWQCHKIGHYKSSCPEYSCFHCGQ